MARRLLLDKSISDDMERVMISKLKTECGCHFTLKLENMFRDKELWTTQSTAFKEYRDNFVQNERTIDISVRVLTAGVWPTHSAPGCILPAPCEQAFNMFNNFYESKHNGRKLTLNTMLGTADVKAVFYGVSSQKPGTSEVRETPKEENKILVVNTHQMVILMCFNSQSRLTFQALSEQTNITERELKRNLQSLAMGKPAQRVLCRKGKGKDIGRFFVVIGELHVFSTWNTLRFLIL
ncbi:cullin family protein [Oesophagostomum dentatum]|uniref:Cullin family protein n=1 Tax=Oesophagostomum dentatum TaxID=61180 RepID=A0A0B1SBK8_OESDE|nr:cullin family protein [Oesophagostomum dentatum]